MNFRHRRKLWQKYCVWKGIDDSNVELILQAYHNDGSGKAPRYYQRIAINRTVEAISKGATRALIHYGHRHWKDLHRISNYVESLEGEAEKENTLFSS